MSRFLKVVTLALLVFFLASSLFAQSQPKDAWPAYPLSIFLGFGSGQYYCGENGTGFLIGDIVGWVGIVAGLATLVNSGWDPNSAYTQHYPPEVSRGYSILGVGMVVWSVSRCWQIIDVFRAVDKAKKAGKVADVVPAIDVDIQRASFELGVSLRY